VHAPRGAPGVLQLKKTGRWKSRKKKKSANSERLRGSNAGKIRTLEAGNEAKVVELDEKAPGREGISTRHKVLSPAGPTPERRGKKTKLLKKSRFPQNYRSSTRGKGMRVWGRKTKP